jgi:hypothetical protein
MWPQAQQASSMLMPAGTAYIGGKSRRQEGEKEEQEEQEIPHGFADAAADHELGIADVGGYGLARLLATSR